MNESRAIAKQVLMDHPHLYRDRLVFRDVMREHHITSSLMILDDIKIRYHMEPILTLPVSFSAILRWETVIHGYFTVAHMKGFDPRELYELVLLKLL